jgi:hypothetical protein
MYLLLGTLARLPTSNLTPLAFSRTRRPRFFQQKLGGKFLQLRLEDLADRYQGTYD